MTYDQSTNEITLAPTTAEPGWYELTIKRKLKPPNSTNFDIDYINIEVQDTCGSTEWKPFEDSVILEVEFGKIASFPLIDMDPTGSCGAVTFSLKEAVKYAKFEGTELVLKPTLKNGAP